MARSGAAALGGQAARGRRYPRPQGAMRLNGIHHITAITADAPGNVRFYAGVLGLRLVKKSVNQDDPTVYHLFYGDEDGSPGADLTFFEYPGAARGSAGAGMVHRIVWRVASAAALDFWERHLRAHGVTGERLRDSLRFSDPEGLQHELRVSHSDDAPLSARSAEIPEEHALQGFDGVRAFSANPSASAALLAQTLGFEPEGEDAWTVRGDSRASFYAYEEPPGAAPGREGAGTVHHVAFAAEPQDEEAWRARVAQSGAHPTPVIERFYFRSVYFREPSGVLFEIATIGPGFAVDEDAEHLGERLSLPPRFEAMRAQLEAVLTPLPNPRASAVTS